MNATTTATRARPRNPFDIPEIRTRISHFVERKDALACARVARAWAQDYLPIIWYTLDCRKFSSQGNISKLHSVVNRYAHYFRVAHNINLVLQMTLLNQAKVNRLRELTIVLTSSTLHYTAALDFIARNSASLEKLELKAESTYNNKYQSPLYCVHAAMIVHPGNALGSNGTFVSRLQDLDISGLWLTRDGLSTILQGCPNLTQLSMNGTDVIGRAALDFQHEGLSSLTCSIITALRPDPTDSQLQPSPGLLVHFPNLNTWSTSGTENELRFVLQSGLLKAEVKQHCKSLKDVRLRDSPESMWVTLFTDVFSNLTEISFDYKVMSVQVLTTILLHQDTVESIQANPGIDIDFEREAFVSPGTDHFQASGRQFQLLPRTCSRLTDLNLYPHVMDMDIVETKAWTCKDLRTLRTRIKGLDSKEKILRAIDLWRAEWKKRALEKRHQPDTRPSGGLEGNNEEWVARFKELVDAAKVPSVILFDNDLSIEARVARHLLQFEKLENVWLGYKTWHPY
ncbi:hypothetical protein BGZ95_010859 [Linnemannia exigua]|uniref:F-box domain-containing protein n=1 Tax=Linnemannia exigua TaxID=604196 RepID=A0AAD4DAQ9_9FUNG|nr:hypothetical protein BGZ95_010859 [Linnemannia exigua]